MLVSTIMAVCRRTLPALTLAALLGGPAVRAAEPLVAVANAVPPAPLLRSAHLLGRQPQSAPVSAGLILPLRNQASLHALLHSLSDPKDPLYGKYLSADEFTRRFSPTQADYDAVVSFARSRGLTVVPHTGRTLVGISGTSASVEKAFNVRLDQYRMPEGRLAYANAAAPRVPASIAARLSGIVGLDDTLLLTPLLRRPVPADVRDSMRPLGTRLAAGPIGTDVSGGLTPADIKNVYNLAHVPYQGEGQNVALVEPGGQFYLGDIGAYVSHFGLPTNAGAIITRYFGGASAATPREPNGETECVLDIDMVLSLAPRINHIFVYVSPALTNDSFVQTIGAIADEDLAQTVSASIGVGETGPELSDRFSIYQSLFNNLEQIYERMAGQGQSLFVSSGDNGAYTDGVNLSVNALASPPTVTAVGGTSLIVNNTSGTLSYSGETTWNDGPGSAGGGGISNFWSKPGYQYANASGRTGAVGLGGQLSPAMRDVPDVSLNADPNTGYAIYVGDTTGSFSDGYANHFEVVGGTSAAAPLWAGFTALVNEGRALGGASPTAGVIPGTPTHPVGFANPVIYAIGNGQYGNYASDFHDIADGSTNLFYPATSGYDDATGWGSFNGANLLADMVAAAGSGATGGGTTTNYTFASGLQMISAPFDFSGTGEDFAGLFGLTAPLQSTDPKLYLWQPLAGAYVSYPTAPADTLRPGIGYWLRAPSGAALHLTGASVASPYTIQLQAGWNQVGDPFQAAEPLSDITVGAAGTPLPQAGSLVGTTLYTYGPSSTSYASETSALQPFIGYWIYAQQPVSLTYTQAGSGSGVPGAPGVP